MIPEDTLIYRGTMKGFINNGAGIVTTYANTIYTSDTRRRFIWFTNYKAREYGKGRLGEFKLRRDIRLLNLDNTANIKQLEKLFGKEFVNASVREKKENQLCRDENGKADYDLAVRLCTEFSEKDLKFDGWCHNSMYMCSTEKANNFHEEIMLCNPDDVLEYVRDIIIQDKTKDEETEYVPFDSKEKYDNKILSQRLDTFSAAERKGKGKGKAKATNSRISLGNVAAPPRPMNLSSLFSEEPTKASTSDISLLGFDDLAPDTANPPSTPRPSTSGLANNSPRTPRQPISSALRLFDDDSPTTPDRGPKGKKKSRRQ